MKTQSTDILAKLLATENLTVIRKNTGTASFDIKNRVLTLPTWKELTPQVEEMLVLHEVGHALYTTIDGYGIVHTEKRYLQGYANILEDVRIEKKMKDRYPGSRKAFNAGYTQLNEKDFFGVKDRDFSELLLIDRINLFYKVGYNAGVPFTAEEYVFVQKADKTVTEDDVIKLAEEIFEFSKAKKEEELEEQHRATRGDGAGGDYEIDIDEDTEVDVEPETTQNFEDALETHVDTKSRTFYFDAVFEIEDKNDPIISYKKIIEELSACHDEISTSRIRKNALKFRQENLNIVNYLVKEFEMRKSASAYKRTKISRLGQLDTRKLFAYQLKEDIFKQIATVQQGKNHGMIFLLDWSGSMNNYMHETVEQVVNLAMFCQKINIPYQVLAFSDGYPRNESTILAPVTPKKINENGLDDMRSFSLLELFSHKMNTRDFNQMIELILDNPWYRNREYGLNGTPLNSSLLYMIDYIGKFMRTNDIEKMNLITLTDGESNQLHRFNYSGTSLNKIASGPTYIMEDGNHVKVDATSILRDPVTRKEYKLGEDAGSQTAALLNLLKDRYNLRSVGFYVTSNSVRSFERFLKYNCSMNRNTYAVAVGIQEKVRRDKAAVLKIVPGRDEMYIVSSTNKIQDEDLDDVKQDMTASQISKQLGKMFNSRKSSRVVLNSFIGQVA